MWLLAAILVLVTSTNDDGPGSLRQAIVDVNRECAQPVFELERRCTIAFQIDDPVIRPVTPLPVVTANVAIDGRGEIVLDGSALTEGNGLTLRSVGFVWISDLAIVNFPGNGIESRGHYVEVRRCRLGDNGLRGIHVEGDESRAIVDDSVISGNRRAGGFFWTSGGVLLERNDIIGNGASGLFFHKPRYSIDGFSAVANAIANNGQAGIAASLAAAGDWGRNTFRDNGGEAIDIGLDGPTLEVTHGWPGLGGVVGAPTVTSARFEDGATIIEGRIATTSDLFRFDSGTVHVYRSAAVDGEADEFLGSVRASPSGDFTFRIERDLRGQFVKASTFFVYVYNWDDPAPGTSELGLPKLVE